MGGSSRSNSVEETTLQVPSLDPRFENCPRRCATQAIWENFENTREN